jgi:hypothetical protein
MTKVKHYLVTLGLKSGLNLHGYVISNDYKVLDRIGATMLAKAIELGGVSSPIMLETSLEGGEKVVQECLFKYVPDSKQLIENVKDFHFTMWCVVEGDPDDKKLMELH